MSEGARRSRLKVRLCFYGSLGLLLLSFVTWLLSFPSGGRFGAAPATIDARLRLDVEELAASIGPRSIFLPEKLAEAEAYITRRFESHGYEVVRRPYDVDGTEVANIEVVLEGSDPSLPCLVIGAHYDTVHTITPGADDNASGVALLLELAASLRNFSSKRTVRLVAFVLEEPPHFHTDEMGSLVYARLLQSEGIGVEAMIALESLGYYSTTPGSQKLPPLLGKFFPDVGDFVGVVGNVRSRPLVDRVANVLKQEDVKVQAAALPSLIPGIGWSDHWSFWQTGTQAVMLTDTAPYRNPHYHEATDTPSTLDYARMATLAQALPTLVEDLSEGTRRSLWSWIVIAMMVAAATLLIAAIWLRARSGARHPA